MSVYVSITGLRLNTPWALPRFYWHALRSLRQAKAAPGLVLAEVRTINGIRHTLTVWESEARMRDYIYAGPHRRAILAFRAFATGKTFGFETDRVPGWEEAHALWQAHGQGYAV